MELNTFGDIQSLNLRRIMPEHIKVNIDLSMGSVSVECSESAFQEILQRIEEFIPKLLTSFPAQERKNGSPLSPLSLPAESEDALPDVAKTNKRRGKARPASTYKMVDLGVDDNAKREFKKVFESNAPKSQNDQVLLCAYWLNKTLTRDAFTDDDIFTALRTAGALKIPSRIESVISNLKLENKLLGERGKYKITHIGEDFVNNDLSKGK